MQKQQQEVKNKEEEEEEEINENEDDAIELLNEDEETQPEISINSTNDYKIKEHTERCEFGELMCFYPDKNGDYQIVIGSFWNIYVIISLTYLGGNLLFYYRYWKYLGSILMKIGLGLYITSLITSLRVFLSNPGVPNTKTNHQLTKLDDNDRDFCEKCKVWNDQQKLIIHCRSCNCCIEDYDQHSAFFCKCIGKGNYISYNIFIVTNLLSLAFIILIMGLTH